MLSIELDPATEKRLAEIARRTGRTEDACARELIEEGVDEYLEDLEDRYVAESRLMARRPALTSMDVRRELGLDS